MSDDDTMTIYGMTPDELYESELMGYHPTPTIARERLQAAMLKILRAKHGYVRPCKLTKQQIKDNSPLGRGEMTEAEIEDDMRERGTWREVATA